MNLKKEKRTLTKKDAGAFVKKLLVLQIVPDFLFVSPTKIYMPNALTIKHHQP